MANYFNMEETMKRLLLAVFALSMFVSAGVNATTIKVEVTEATLTDTEAGCACNYTVKNLNTAPLKSFEASVFIKSKEQRPIQCDPVHFSFSKPIEPNQSKILSNRANGKACGKNPSAEFTMVMACKFTDGTECSSDEVEVTDTRLDWIEFE